MQRAFQNLVRIATVEVCHFLNAYVKLFHVFRLGTIQRLENFLFTTCPGKFGQPTALGGIIALGKVKG